MRMLVFKEARSQMFGACLILVWLMVEWGTYLLTKHPDRLSLAQSFANSSGSWEMLLMFVAGLALAQGALVREQDEGTLHFLDALPVSRDRVFAVKFVLALGLVWLLPINWLAQHVCFQWLSRDSHDMEFHWGA